ncbi:chitobiase/beta-hexosaminidase C-terminal domain-containing protein [Corallococcus macrosporus]|uniref:Chitobiase/beta-hexosaminidase C-terminal domain-containing protein n=1 Tax=Corallococcus macrosporus TaxID=35 RepID=A0ABS3DMQ9_9BACT|nr:chitobiase/beta-hexosaminidase C-terminal domain-containing protein [Corallococcus macrosporus]
MFGFALFAIACGSNSSPPPAATDTTPPSVQATPRGGTFKADVSVTLSCEDGTGSGCDATRYTLDGTVPTQDSPRYTAPLQLSANATLKFFSVDKAGNVGAVQAEVYAFDAIAPATSASPKGGTYGSPQTVTLACADARDCAGTYYTLDGTTPTRTSPRYSVPVSLSANATLKFFSVDTVGNEEPVRSESYVIDTLKPTVAASIRGGVYNSARTVTLACTDDDSGSGCASIHYTTHGGTPDTGSATYAAPLELSADTSLKFLAVDNAGNVSAVQTEVYAFDTDAPRTSASPSGGVYGSALDVTLTCADPHGCAGTYYTLDGTTPTRASSRYAAPIRLSANATLRFFSVDTAGNEEPVRTEEFVFDYVDTTAPRTSAFPPGIVESAEQLDVSLSCDDNGGSGCAETYYTLDGSVPTTSSTRYTGAPITVRGHVRLRFFSVDNANNMETPGYEMYSISTLANTSSQIATIRSRPDGPISESLAGAFITHTKPLTGADPAGVFLQAEKDGPAVFLVFDFPSGTRAGDRMAFRATEKTTVNGMVHITRLDAWVVYFTRDPVDGLVSEVSNTDLVTNLDAYESKLISVTGTVASPLGPSGGGNVSASFVTMGNPAIHPNLKLRLTNTVSDTHDVTQDCALTTTAPLWRFNTQAQPSAWSLDDINLLSCPGPKVTGAVAGGNTSVTVNFDRKLDPASVLADGSQFTVDSGLGVQAAAVSGRQVLLTTSAQAAGTGYTVTVASSVKDTRQSGLETTANSATFTGVAVSPARLVLTEVAPGISNGKDLVELVAVEGGSVDRFTLTQGANLLLATFPNVVVATGDVIVVHLRPTTAPVDAPASETANKGEFPESTYSANSNIAWDFIGSTNEIGYSQRVLRVRDATGVTQDGVPFYRPPPPGGSVTNDYYPQLQALQAEGQWLPSSCGGAPCNGTSTPAASEVSAGWADLPFTKATSVRRVAATDNDLASDWAVGPSSFGSHAP